MNKYLQDLVELSLTDKEIEGFAVEEKKAKVELDKTLAKIELNKKELVKVQDDIKEIDDKKSKSNIAIKELVDKLKGSDKKTAAIKTEREMRALQVEEGIAKERVDSLNADIERLDKIVQDKKSQAKTLKATISELTSRIDDLQQKADEKLKTIETQKRVSLETREAQTKDFPQKLLGFYQKIRCWAKDTTVVPVRKQACYGCYMRLNDKVYSEILRSEEIVNCPHCGRILYIENV